MAVNGFLFLLGTLIRWPVQNTKDFLVFHSYIVIMYGITLLVKSLSINASYFVFTIGMLSPIMISIYKGLPLDCLNYQSVIEKENTEASVL